MSNTVTRATLADGKSALATVVELVTFLFAAFNGYAAAIAPPHSRAGGMSPEAAVGFASFAALLVFLMVKAWMVTRQPERRRPIWFWITLLLTLTYIVTGFAYERVTADTTFAYPLGRIDGRLEVAGTVLTRRGTEERETFSRASGREPLPAELVADTDGGLEAIPLLWTPASVREAHDSLVRYYVLLVVVLSLAIASLIELTLAVPPAGQATVASNPQHTRDPLLQPAA